MSAGVGGATGLKLRDADGNVVFGEAIMLELVISLLGNEGVKGSFVMSGNEGSWPASFCMRSSIDLTNTTWQFSGFQKSRSASKRQHADNIQGKMIPPWRQRPSRSIPSSTL